MEMHRFSLSEIPLTLRVMNWGGGRGERGSYSNERITGSGSSQNLSVAVHPSLLLSLSLTQLTTGPNCSREQPNEIDPLPLLLFSLHTIIHLYLLTPAAVCFFSHAYSLAGSLRRVLLPFPIAILTFPQHPRTALRDSLLKRNPHAPRHHKKCFFLSPLDLWCYDHDSPQRRNFLIDTDPLAPRRIFLFSHTSTALHINKHGYKDPDPWSNLNKMKKFRKVQAVSFDGVERRRRLRTAMVGASLQLSTCRYMLPVTEVVACG
jgi:hypothetical protein